MDPTDTTTAVVTDEPAATDAAPSPTQADQPPPAADAVPSTENVNVVEPDTAPEVAQPQPPSPPPTTAASDALAQARAELAALEEGVEIKSAQLGYLCNEFLANARSIEHYYEPKLQPLQIITYASQEKQAYIELQIKWLERCIVQADQRAHTGTFIFNRDMRDDAEALMKPAQQALFRSYEAIRECPRDALHTLSGYATPPEEFIDTLHLVMRLRGEDDCSWKAAQIILTVNYFTTFFVGRAEALLKVQDTLPDDLMLELELFCDRPEHSPQALFRRSTPIGCLGQWLRALRDYYRVKLVTAPVLLRDATAENTARVTALVQRITFGPAVSSMSTDSSPAAITTSATGDEGEEGSVQRNGNCEADGQPDNNNNEKKQRLSVTQSNGDAGQPIGSADGEAEDNEATERALKSQMARTSQRLAMQSHPSLTFQTQLCELRTRLHRLKTDTADAQEAMTKLQQELYERMRQLQTSYDGSMVPLEDSLEETADAFVRLVTEPVVKAAPATTAAES